MLDGKPFPAEPGPDRGIVFQRYSVFPHLTVLGNVLIGYEFQQSPLSGRLFGPARRAAIERSRELIEAVGLGPHCDKYPSALSGGMQQRLAIAQALSASAAGAAARRAVRRARPRHRAEMHAAHQAAVG